MCRLTVSLRFLPLRGFLPPRGFYRSAVFTAPRFLPLRGFYRSAFTGSLGGFALPPPSCLLPPSLPPLPDGSLLVPPCGSTAIFTAPRFFPLRGFLPLRGFYRSAFTGSLGGFDLPPPSCLLPLSLHPLPGSSLFGPPCGTPAIFTAPQFLPLRGFYRSAVFYRSAIFTAPRFLPLRDFCRSAVFTAPRFLPLRFRRFFGGLCSSTALVLAAPQSSPTSGRLALWATLRYACDFYRSGLFTAPRFLPLRDFYRSAIFTAPRFLPLRDFYRSAVFTAPRFLLLRGFYRSAIFSAPFSPVLWGALLFLSAPQSSPSSGRTLCYRLFRSVSGGTPFLIFFLYHLLNRSRSVTAHLTGFPFVHFIHIRGSSVVSSFE